MTYLAETFYYHVTSICYFGRLYLPRGFIPGKGAVPPKEKSIYMHFTSCKSIVASPPIKKVGLTLDWGKNA